MKLAHLDLTLASSSSSAPSYASVIVVSGAFHPGMDYLAPVIE